MTRTSNLILGWLKKQTKQNKPTKNKNKTKNKTKKEKEELSLVIFI